MLFLIVSAAVLGAMEITPAGALSVDACTLGRAGTATIGLAKDLPRTGSIIRRTPRPYLRQAADVLLPGAPVRFDY